MNITPSTPPIALVTYPARPVDGGRLELCRTPKSGQWFVEPKYNGWRAFVHVPTGTMFNRKGERLSIAAEFAQALAVLRRLPVLWADTEALSRRHNIGRGSLILFDFLGGQQEVWEGLQIATLPRLGGLRDAPYTARRRFLNFAARRAGIQVHTELATPIRDNAVYLAPAYKADGARPVYDLLKACNAELEAAPRPTPNARPARTPARTTASPARTFFEGIVMKRADSLYPIQLRDPEAETHVWVKHRWHF